ncbi:hypothetical protein KURONO_1641 [Mycobacterium tuberculosis str. Kurono]|nr:hypothetical protein EI32_4302 [Mycobacterium tuberculosis]KXN94879.1 hypothetical protein HX91_0733 [Mycobacterium tuberculosis]BAQ05440.1 hypothetical protein KURONO_1641 [Mycobacterium tuberculosis str. Kurono]
MAAEPQGRFTRLRRHIGTARQPEPRSGQFSHQPDENRYLGLISVTP